MIGRVVSVKMQKTVAILVEGKKTHPLYNKTYVWSKKYLVHDEIGAKLGDVVIVEATRPISKRVHWKINKIVGADVVALGEAAMKQVEEEAIAEVMPVEEEVEKSEESAEKVTASAVIPSQGEGSAKEKETKAKKPKAKKEKK